MVVRGPYRITNTSNLEHLERSSTKIPHIYSRAMTVNYDFEHLAYGPMDYPRGFVVCGQLTASEPGRSPKYICLPLESKQRTSNS